MVVLALLGYNEYKRDKEENDPTPTLTYANANNVDLPSAEADIPYKPLADATTVGNIPETNLTAAQVRGGRRSKRKSKRRKTSKRRKHRTHRKK